MLQRQKLWVPVLEHNPSFAEYFRRFITNNPLTSLNVAALNIQPENMYVALQPDPRHTAAAGAVAAKLAVRLKVNRAACDASVLDGGQPCMCFGFATALVDSMNSFHVMERLLPVYVPHVSVNIQSQLCQPSMSALAHGTDIVVVSSIDKFGKRMVYCATDFYRDEDIVDTAVVEREANVSSLTDLDAALTHYRRLLHGTHVKSILWKDEKKAKA